MEQTVWSGARTAATLLARLVLALVFGLAAVSKITAPGPFRSDVQSYHLLPAGLVGPFALAVPWIEALITLYLVIGLFLRPTAVVTALLLCVFTGALAISVANGNTAHSCGCLPTSGPLGSLPLVTWLAGGSTIGLFDVLRDVVFIGLTALIFWGDRRTLSLDGVLFGRATTGFDELDTDYDDEEIAAPAPPQTPRAGTRRA